MLAKLSSLLLTNIDGIMIGNYVGSDALSAVNIFYPTELIIGSVVTMLCAGVSNYIPVIIGRNEPDRLNAAYCAISIIKKIFAAVITLLQIPLIYLQILKEGGSKMKKRRRSAVSIIMALGLVLSLSGCAPSVDVSVKPKEASREPIELTWWVYSSGAAPIDTELVQEAAKACVNKCVAQMMHIRLAKDAKLGIENLYWLTDGRMRVDNHYKAVLIGSDAGKEKTYMLATPALIRESAEGLSDDELADYLIQSFAGWGVLG